MPDSLRQMIATGDAFQGYAYAYPHKFAYRPLQPAVPLTEAWAQEDKSALFLYVHVPFCTVRCGFCNLFTTPNPVEGMASRYLDALFRQAEAVSAALGTGAHFARLAIGGGTPTFLDVAELARLFSIVREFRGIAGSIPKTIEASPGTIDPEKAALFRSQGITRVSLGVQSFIEAETRSLGRPQRLADVRQALGLLCEARFSCLNVDLIYGIQGQTVASWQRSIEEALEFAPQEIYLYPLYVRPLTGLGRAGAEAPDSRLALYRAGRDLLMSHGYRPVSMRLFRAAAYRSPEGPIYCCQEDGMAGLGAGARSYTSGLHYSTEYAVRRTNVESILGHFISRTPDRFAEADYGCFLDATEQKRRYVVKSLLRSDGLDLAAYRARFGSSVFDDLPGLEEVEEQLLAERSADALRLNERGLELSDVIGPWLCSTAMRARMDSFALT